METCCECGINFLPGTGGSEWSDGVNYPYIVCSDECEDSLLKSMSGFRNDGSIYSDGMTGRNF